VFYGRGINHYNVDKEYSGGDNKHSTIHAEVDAINHLRYTTKRTKVNLFVFRTNPQGTRLMMAKPCEHCMKYINTNIQRKGYRLHRIYYTDWEGDIKYV
jgi:cytidine deaminase